MMEKNKDNAIRNSFFALVFRILQIIFPFVSRTIIIHTLGLAYVGVSGLFTSLFGLMGIAELGIGSALLQSLYEPIRNNDKSKVRAILNFYRKAYFIIGIVIAIIGIVLTPFLKKLIREGTYPSDLNIYYIYFVNLFGTVVGYMVYSYKTLLLEANQRGRDANKIRILVSFIQYFIQIPLLLITRNYYIYISIVPVTTMLCILMIARICDKEFPGYAPVGDIEYNDKKILKENIFALFLYKIGGIVNNNVDGIVISVLLGATILGAFNNYYYLVSSISTLISISYLAILPSLGNFLVNKTKKEIFTVFRTMCFWDAWLVGWCSICFVCLLEPFIIVWAGSSTSQGKLFSYLFAIYFYVWRFPDVLSMIKDSQGLWKKDKWRPFCTAILNLVLNIVLTKHIGLYGILLSTIIAVLVMNFPVSMMVVLNYLERRPCEFLIPQLQSLIVIIISGYLTAILCSKVPVEWGFVSIFIRLLICIIFPNIIYYLVYRNHDEMKKVKHLVINKMKGCKQSEANKENRKKNG